MNALNQNITKLTDYLRSNRLNSYPFRMDEDYVRQSSLVQYDPITKILFYQGWDESHHNGDSYNQVDFELSIGSSEELDKIYQVYLKQALFKAGQDLLLEKKKEESLRKENEIKQFLDSKINSNSVRFIKDEIPLNSPLEIIDDNFLNRVRDTSFVVEASRFEQITLWQKNVTRSYPFTLSNEGWCKRIGHNPQSTMSYTFGFYRDLKIFFWEITSEKADFGQVEKYIKLHLPELYEKNFNCDAQNFGNCLNALDRILDPNSIQFIKGN